MGHIALAADRRWGGTPACAVGFKRLRFLGNGHVKQNAARTRFGRARTDVSDKHPNIHLTSRA